jgi:hypothetical protein
MTLDFPFKIGSIKYRLANTTPRTPLSNNGAPGCSMEISAATHAPFGKFVHVVLLKINV